MNAHIELAPTNAPTQIAAPASLSRWQLVALFLVSCAVLVERLPGRLFHPQFYSEDGKIWYAEAYNLGWWHAMLRPWTGYFLTLPRIVAAFSQLVPLRDAPLLFNAVAICAQALPVTVLLSSRSAAWGSLRFRFLLAALYLALPNCLELTFGITESQWHLALAAFLLLVASVPRTAAGRALDLALFLLSGLSGPFCIFLFPIAAFVAFSRKDKRRWLPVAVLGFGCAVQCFGLLVLDRTGRPHHPIGASFDLFVRIVGGRIVLSALIGHNGLPTAPGTGLFEVLVCLTVLGIAIVVICFIQSNVEMRLFLVFSAMIFGASLVSVTTEQPPEVSFWHILVGYSDLRYWLFPSLALVWSLAECARNRQPVLKFAAVSLLIVMLFGIVRDWQQPAFNDLHFAEQAERFENAPVGTTVIIPGNPERWPLTLIKH